MSHYPPSGGYGPWFCAFVVNTATHPKKYTHVVAHTLPHLVVDALNKNSSSSEEDCWIMVFKIGPFNYWMDSVAFLNQWLCKTRGKTHRMERGLELFALYREQFRLCLWSQTRARNQALYYFHNEQALVVIPAVPTSPTTAAAATLQGPDMSKEQREQRFRDWLQETKDMFTRAEQPTLAMIRSRIY
jgi:hypothetical protein